MADANRGSTTTPVGGSGVTAGGGSAGAPSLTSFTTCGEELEASRIGTGGTSTDDSFPLAKELAVRTDGERYPTISTASATAHAGGTRVAYAYGDARATPNCGYLSTRGKGFDYQRL